MAPETRLLRSTLFLPTDESARNPATIAGTLLADPWASGPSIVCFAFPGGGYTRAYFDLHHAELSGPSQAEYHAERGLVFIACDPFGGGESTRLEPEKLGLEATADAFHAIVEAALDRLRSGTLLEQLAPIQVTGCVGVGHSLGGMQLIVQQARHATFDAVAVLGFSAVHTTIPTPDGVIAPHGTTSGPGIQSLDEAWAGPLVDDLAHLRYAYHWEDVSPVLVLEDMSVGFPVRTAKTLPPWISDTFPPFAAVCLEPGVVAADAARITVPVFVGAGERDVVSNLHAEAAAYSASKDVTLVRLPRTAHMHNFSPRREVSWARLQRWIEGLDSMIDQ